MFKGVLSFSTSVIAAISKRKKVLDSHLHQIVNHKTRKNEKESEGERDEKKGKKEGD